MAEQTIVSRIQNRRGLKQDLPSPLRPGELGFASDTRQLYIGADTNRTSDIFNKSARYESVINAQALTESLANVNMIRFTVPHRRFERGFSRFDGIEKRFPWNVDSNQIADNTGTDNPVFPASPSEFEDLQDGNAFDTESITVIKNGTILTGDPNGSREDIANGRDYFFMSGTTSTDEHEITFRTAPTRTDEVGIIYYDSQDIFDAISRSNDIGADGDNSQGIIGFHSDTTGDTLPIPSYRQIERKNIQISVSTGVGFIGLSPKHTLISTDISHSPEMVLPISTGDLGNIFISRNDERATVTGITRQGTSNTDFIVSMSTSDKLNFAGKTYAYLSGVNATNAELNGRVYSIIDGDNADNIGVRVLDISASTRRGVTGVTVGASSMSIVVENADNIEAQDLLYFLDPNNVVNSGSTQYAASVTAVSGLTVTTTLPLDGTATTPASTADLSTVEFSTRKDGGDNRDFVIYAKNHGFSNGHSIRATNTGVNFITATNGVAISDVTDDTFILRVTTASRSLTNISAAGSFNIYPAFTTDSAATGSVTPVYVVNLSTVDSLSNAVIAFNDPMTNMPVSLNFVPNTSDQVYITEKISSPAGFRIHDDSLETASGKLKIGAGEYTRRNSTVKARLELWLNRVRTGTNMISSLGINEPFSNIPTNDRASWSLTTNSIGDEIIFDSNEEVRNFVDIINNIYYETENVDIKGLLNVKTNIEVLTINNQNSNTIDVYYDATARIDISNGNHTYAVLGMDLDEVNTTFIEYSMKDQNPSVSINYARIGTLQISGDRDAEAALIQDIFTENKDGITGGELEITATYSSGDIVININNTLQPITNVTMAFVRKRWSV